MGLRKTLFGLSALTTALLLSSCGSGEDKQAEKQLTPAESDMPVTLTFAFPGSGKTDELFKNRFGEQIKKKFPNYTIEYIPFADLPSFTLSLESNKALDIMITSYPNLYAHYFDLGLESDITSLIKKYNYDLTKLDPSAVEVQKHVGGKGGIYGLPYTNGSLVFLYNKDLFDRFGVGYPKDGNTWDETYELARKMTRTDSGVKYRGLLLAFEHLMGRNQLSAPYFDTKTFKAVFAEPNFVRSFENLARFYKINGNELPDNKYSLGALRNFFMKDQTAAMLLDTGGNVSSTANAMTNWDLTTFPEYADKRGVGYASYPEYALLTKLSKNQDAAFRVLEYVTSVEYQSFQASTFATAPSIKNVDEVMKSFGSQIKGASGKNFKAMIPKKYADIQGLTPYFNIGNSEMVAALGEYSSTDINTAIRNAAERANKKVTEELAKKK
ncbi:MAG: hypothetical protein K0Q59_2059 [Paenibacillus sp.]|nr:hypothetical protein [Paenibacillus sp.]